MKIPKYIKDAIVWCTDKWMHASDMNLCTNGDTKYFSSPGLHGWKFNQVFPFQNWMNEYIGTPRPFFMDARFNKAYLEWYPSLKHLFENSSGEMWMAPYGKDGIISLYNKKPYMTLKDVYHSNHGRIAAPESVIRKYKKGAYCSSVPVVRTCLLTISDSSNPDGYVCRSGENLFFAFTEQIITRNKADMPMIHRIPSRFFIEKVPEGIGPVGVDVYFH